MLTVERLRRLRRAPGPGAEGGDRTVAVSGFQRAMAKKMEEALRVPHFTFCDEVNMDKLVELRAMLKPA